MTVKSLVLSWGMVIVYVALNSYGALALKYQIQRVGKTEMGSLSAVFSYFFTLFSSPQSIAALIAIFGSSAAWIIALSRLNLSSAYPIAVGANFLIVIAVATIFYNEPLPMTKIAGIGLIMLGMTLVFQS